MNTDFITLNDQLRQRKQTFGFCRHISTVVMFVVSLSISHRHAIKVCLDA